VVRTQPPPFEEINIDKYHKVLYNVRCMLQIVNITDARNNLAKLIKRIRVTKEPVVLIQDSIPSVVLYPYDEIRKQEEESNKLFKLKFDAVFKEGKKSFRKYLNKKSIRTPLSEQKAYSVIKNA
jgi:prevent-host-death family protein